MQYWITLYFIGKPYQKPFIRSATKYAEKGDLVLVTCLADRLGLDLHWTQKRLDGTEVRVPKKREDESEQQTEDGEKKKALRLLIHPLGWGGYGEYVCKQEFKGKYTEASLRVLPPKDSKLL